MRTITLAEAIAYAASTETAWNGAASAVTWCKYHASSDDMSAYYDVHTTEHDWSVWIDSNGNVYGEC